MRGLTYTPQGYIVLSMPRKASRTVTARIHRLSGQLQAIEKMIADRRTCPDVLTQIGAVRAGLEQVALLVLQKELQRSQNRRVNPETTEKLLQAFSKSQ